MVSSDPDLPSSIEGYEPTGEVIGRGPNGKVTLLKKTSEAESLHPNWPPTLALKTFKGSAQPRALKLKHRNIAFVFTPSPPGTVLTQHCSTSLAEFLDVAHAAGTLVYGQIRQTGFHVLSALAHMHALQLTHGNIKPENVLLEEDAAKDGEGDNVPAGYHAKLSDAGVPCGRNSPYAAPEIRRDGPEAACPASDIYSLGIVLLEMATGRENLAQAVRTRRSLERTLRMVRNPDLVNCLGELLKAEASARPPARDMIKHPFFMPKKGEDEDEDNPSDEDEVNPVLAMCNLIILIFAVGTVLAVIVLSALYFRNVYVNW